MPKGIHDGHRERFRDEFRDGNFNEKTPPHKVLEALLFYSIPRVDTNDIAHELINKFGSFEAVFEASEKELMSVKGVGENTAIFIKLISISVKRVFENRHREIKCYTSLTDACDMILEKYFGVDHEMVSVLCIEASGKFAGYHVVGEGDISSVGISIRTILEAVIESNASTVILAHNHPHGTCVPSSADLEATKQIYKTLRDINVVLLDHIIIANNDYVSLKCSSQFKDCFK